MKLAAILFEDRLYSLSIQRQVQNAIHTMLTTLRDIDQEDIIVRTYNNIAIAVDRVDCDYYQFLEGDPHVQDQFTGEYMNNYSWAEPTSAFLLSRIS